MLQQELQTATPAEIEHTVRQHLAAFAHGDFDAWGAQLAPDVFFTAADPEEVFSNRQDAVAEMHKDFDPAFDEDLKLDIRPLSFRTGVSKDGSAAWCATPLEYTVHFRGETTSFLIRHSDVLTKSDRGWTIVATKYSLVLPEAKILQALAGGQLPAPRRVGDAVGPGAEGLIQQFTEQLTDLSKARISPAAHAFGPLPGEDAEGESAVSQLFATWASRWDVLQLRPEGICAQLLSNAELGWVGANLDADMQQTDRQVAIPMRALIVYQKQQEIWSIVHAHVSVGIPDDLAE
jgi:ketosteroid isomerase-like protein